VPTTLTLLPPAPPPAADGAEAVSTSTGGNLFLTCSWKESCCTEDPGLSWLSCDMELESLSLLLVGDNATCLRKQTKSVKLQNKP
jgi:hypothetical protein